MRAVQRSLAVAALLAAVFYVAACGDDPESNNLPPTVELIAGPMDGDSTAWNASFRWSGSDLDGYVDHYEYALDVPPERIDDITSPRRPGSTGYRRRLSRGVFRSPRLKWTRPTATTACRDRRRVGPGCTPS
jgi:hypothetical protein